LRQLRKDTTQIGIESLFITLKDGLTKNKSGLTEREKNIEYFKYFGGFFMSVERLLGSF
jgi:hypothetical protein